MAADPEAEKSALASVEAWKEERDETEVADALSQLAEDAKSGVNLMTATLAAARAGATTGEWAGTLREVFGEFRAPTGVSGAVGVAEAGAELTTVREAVRRTGEELAGHEGGRLRLLVGKPGLDGHSNGAEQVAVRARDAGFEVIYQGIRLTPEQIVAAAVAEDVHCVGLSILSGSHMELVPSVLEGLQEAGMGDVPVIVGGIIPDSDGKRLDRARRGRGLHAQGLRAHRDHGRHRQVIRKANGLADPELGLRSTTLQQDPADEGDRGAGHHHAEPGGLKMTPVPEARRQTSPAGQRRPG